ncbi:MAG TPA: hypothetical protein VI685_21110 [Candidatus Angelobacter sp.]
MSRVSELFMPIGQCKLCLLTKELQDSHFINAALYRIANRRGGAIVKTPELFIAISNQVHDYVLCRECEQLFSRKGEDYVMPLVKQDDNDFPLLKILTQGKPLAPTGPNNGTPFSGPATGIDTEKLAYYALSMFWRGAVHVWKTLNRQTTSVNMNAEDQEAIRKYLHEESGWPPGIVLQVTVCTDLFSQDNVLAPVDWENDMYKGSSMVIFGIFFVMVRGVRPGESDWNLCCRTPPNYVIFRHDCGSTSRALEDDMRKTAKIADNLKKKKKP